VRRSRSLPAIRKLRNTVQLRDDRGDVERHFPEFPTVDGRHATNLVIVLVPGAGARNSAGFAPFDG